MLTRRVWPSRPAFEDTFSDFEHMRNAMLRLLDVPAGADASPGLGGGHFPAMNVTQDDDNFYVRTEVPGIKPNEISVSAVKNRVSIAAKRSIPAEQERVSYHRRERAEGSFNRTVSLPANFDAERVEARYANGVLTLTLPKEPQAKPRQIVVKS